MKPFALSLSKGILCFDRLSTNAVVSRKTHRLTGLLAGECR